MKLKKIMLSTLCFVISIKAIDRSNRPMMTSPASFASESPIPGELDWQRTARFYHMREQQKLADLKEQAKQFLNVPENRTSINRKAQRYFDDFKQQNAKYLAYLQQNLNPRNWDEEKKKILQVYRPLFFAPDLSREWKVFSSPDLSRAWIVVNEEAFKAFEELVEELFTSIFRASRVSTSEKE